ncbi:MAG: dephospho-CoA kinase [Bacteroidia bacterium]|nr:dephospho-CoA kinase [Bacteroidia bacterium]
MQKIGITGSIGSGKSIVCKIFEQLGVPTYYADDRAKFLMNSNPEIIANIKQLFGNESYTEIGELNRKHLSNIAFTNKDLLTQLNKIVHPIVFNDFDNWLIEKETLKVKYIIKEAALMFETESYKKLDKFIVVTAPIALRISRTMQRDSILKEQVLLRMNNQFSQEDKLAKADYEIKNDEQNSVIEQVYNLHQLLNK